MTVRPALEEDLPGIEALYTAVVEDMHGAPYDAYWEMGVHPTREGLRDRCRVGNLFVAEGDSHRLVGAFVLDGEQAAGYEQVPWHVAASPDKVQVIHLLAVAPDARGLGVGRRLVEGAAHIARERGARSVRLDAIASNAPAVALYRSCGFADLGVFSLDYGEGFLCDARLMELDLAPARRLLDPASLASCELCPRRCGANRAAGARGACGAANTLRLARAALHMWEEPPISGDAGSGTIFFSGCPLRCVYCQNHEISTGNFGIEVPPERLFEIMLELQDQGALNINLVTATHYAHLLPQALADARRRGLSIPIVYNTSGYERVEAIRELEGLVDIWLTDFKYASSRLGSELSHVPDYPQVAAAALTEMAAQVERAGGQASRGDGTWTRGIIVRHLVLPGHADDSCRVLDQIWDAAGDVPVSVMNQYTPNAAMRATGGQLSRAVTNQEYEQVLDHADDLGFSTMFWQEGGAVDESFTPPFDITGVLVRADAGSGTLRAKKGDAS